MSLIEGLDARGEVDAIDLVERIATYHDWEFDRIADDQIAMAVEGRWRTYSITLAWSHSDEVLRLVSTFELEPSGPSMFALADVGAYLAILSRIGPVALAVTTNCSIDFMRKPAAGVDLICETRLLKLGRALAVCDCLVFSEAQGDPVARASLTYAIPPNANRPAASQGPPL